MSDTICHEGTIWSELGRLHYFPSAVRVGVRCKRNIKADDLSLPVEAGENNIVFDSVNERIIGRPLVNVGQPRDVHRTARRYSDSVRGTATARVQETLKNMCGSQVTHLQAPQ